MPGDGEAIERARLLILEAALDETQWPRALAAVADACGARSGQLIELDDQGAVRTHWLTQVPDDFIQTIEAFGLSNPVVNPRMRIGAHAAPLQMVADQDYVDADTRRRHPIYAEMFEPHDLLFNCQTVLQRNAAGLTRMSVTRTRRQGPMDASAFRAFAELAPYVETAVRLRTTLQAARTTAMVQTLDAIGAPAFLLNESGRVIAASAEGETLAVLGDMLQLKGGMLRPALEADRPAFDERVGKALEAARDPAVWAACPSVPVHSKVDGSDTLFEIQPLPPERAGGQQGPAVLIIASGQRRPGPGRAERLERRFGLTQAEAAVAVRIAQGESLNSIAAARAVSRSTIRSQLQTIYLKMDVHRQGELVALVHEIV